jgi:hypothetical protein
MTQFKLDPTQQVTLHLAYISGSSFVGRLLLAAVGARSRV